MAERVSDRLATYRKKRDFSVTPEPSGLASVVRRPAGRTDGASSSSGTGRRGLHYDLRLEAAGVLLSWAVPKGPDARPRRPTDGGARRGPSARLLRLRRRDPGRRVRRRRRDRLGLGHVVAGRGRRSARRRSPTGDLHFDLHGREAVGPVRARASRRVRVEREQWLLIHKHDDVPSPAGTPRTIRGPSSPGAPTTRSRPRRGDVVERAAVGRGRRTTSWPRSTGSAKSGGTMDVRRPHAAADQPRQGAVPCQAPARRSPSATLIRHYATARPGDPAVRWTTGRSTCTAIPTASTARVLAQGRARRTPRTGSLSGGTPTPTRARPRCTRCSTPRRAWRGRPTSVPSSCTRGRRPSIIPTVRRGRWSTSIPASRARSTTS